MTESYDVVVVGGGPAGVAAAVSAARAGARTLIVERNGFFGGAATAAAVTQFLGWMTPSGRQVIAGFGEEVVQRLVTAGGSDGHAWYQMSTGMKMDRVVFDPEVLKVVYDQLVAESGATTLFHSMVARVERRGRSIDRVILLTKSGEVAIEPRTAIDASGELDLLEQAGCEMLPLEDGEELQPATMSFRMGPIDFERYNRITVGEKRAIAERGLADGVLTRLALNCYRVPNSDDGWFNVTRLAVDGTDAYALSKAEMEGRRLALAAARFITANLPGFDRARLNGIATQLGIRQTRRVRGDIVLAADDLLTGRVFEDAISSGAYPIDVHETRGPSIRLERTGDDDHSYTIPLRSLIPASLDNAMVAGRGLSATHVAFSAVRTMPQAMALGQAEGVTAALAASGNAPVSQVVYAKVRAELLKGGAVLP